MKTNGNLSKIVSTSMALMLCFAMLLFAVMMLWAMAAPVHAQRHVYAANGVSINPTSGPVDTSVTVTGTGVMTSDPIPVPVPTNALVTFDVITTSSTCSSSSGTPVGGTVNPTTAGNFSGSFHWPTSGTVSAQGTYTVCATIVSGASMEKLAAGNFQVTASTTGSASVSADSSSYTVGDDMQVDGTGFSPSTKVTVELQSSDGKTTTTLGTGVTTDLNGAFTQVYKVPAHPLNTVVLKVTDGGSTTLATSGSFTVKAKAAAKPKPTPTPKPAPVPTSPPYVPPPPAVLLATPTPVPTTAPTDTPTAVPTDTPTPVPSPTVAPTPVSTPVQVVANKNNTLSNLLSGRLPAILAIGLGTLLGLGILFFVGRLVMRKFLSPAPPPNMSPSGAPPWTRSREESLGNTGMNGVSFAQTMPINDFSPGYGGFPPANGQPQQVPFPTSNGGFAPGNSPVPFNSPFMPGNGGFPPPNDQPQQVPFPPSNGGFAPDNSPVPFNSPFAPGNAGFPPPGNVPQEPFPPGNDWLVPSQ